MKCRCIRCSSKFDSDDGCLDVEAKKDSSRALGIGFTIKFHSEFECNPESVLCINCFRCWLMDIGFERQLAEEISNHYRIVTRRR